MRRAAVLLLAVLAGCVGDYEARVDGALLPQAFGVVPAGEGVTLAVKPGQVPTVLPTAVGDDPRVVPTVKLAIDIKVPWKDVAALLDRADRSGVATTLLVGQRYRVKGFVLSDRLDLGQTLKVRALEGGKFCVSPPGTDKAYCLESGDRQHISALFARGVMQKAVAQYGIAQARVVADPDLQWADLVRAVDGTRTCCPGMKVMVVR